MCYYRKWSASNVSVFSLDLQTLTFGDVVAVRHYEKA